MQGDPWLERRLETMRRLAEDPAILELGCGPGQDTAWLARHGFTRITATDLSTEALAKCALAAPAAHLVCHDLHEPLPFADDSFDVVIASLCLHYFEWDKTEEIVRDIRRCLRPESLLLCRLNSTNDVHYGAVGHKEIAHHYYDVDGDPKRFFDSSEIDALFRAGWNCLFKEESVINRYEKAKAVWEIVLRKK